VKEDALVPALTPLTCHWYWGLGPGFWGVAVKVTLMPEQTGLAEAEMVRETGRYGSTVRVRMFDMAGLPEAQVVLDVRMQDTRSPLFGVYVNVVLFVPAFVPLTCHWQEGELPPLTGVAVKLTLVPVHTGLAEAVMLTDTGRPGMTLIVTVFEVAGLPEGHP